MVIISYFSGVIPIFVFIICLITLVESHFNCPTSTPNPDEAPQTFIVQLSSTASRDVINNHYAMLTSCYNKIISDASTNQQNNPNIIKDVSFGSFNCYIGQFSPSDTAGLARLPEVVNIESDIKYHIVQTSIPTNPVNNPTNPVNTPTPTNTGTSATPTNSPTVPKNLDRIDQAKRPLDGKYTFPSSAGVNVTVYIIDTGINVKNEEFGGRAILGPLFCDECPKNEDDVGHGSNVAGIVGGSEFGVAKKTSLVSVKICNANGCQISDLLKALSYVEKQHSKSSNKNTVINMSLGGPLTQSINKAVIELGQKGIHVVAAAGNDASDACNVSPASAPNAIAVGATDTADDDIAYFSNIGKCVNIFAPGVDITAAGNQSPTDLITFSGTSQASPHVAGTIALIIASSGNKSPPAMKKFLDDLSTKKVVGGPIGGSPNRFLRVPHP